MATAQLTVDDTNKKIAVSFLDDKGDSGAQPAPGGTATFSVQGGTTTVAPDASNPFAGDITPGPDGDSGTFVVSFNGTVMEQDGVTAIADPAPVPYTVGPGGAVSASASVQ